MESNGVPLSWRTYATEARLWYPIGFEVEAVLQWRNYLQQQNIVQPFKQAYREVYILTEAALRTHAYSTGELRPCGRRREPKSALNCWLRKTVHETRRNLEGGFRRSFRPGTGADSVVQ